MFDVHFYAKFFISIIHNLRQRFLNRYLRFFWKLISYLIHFLVYKDIFWFRNPFLWPEIPLFWPKDVLLFWAPSLHSISKISILSTPYFRQTEKIISCFKRCIYMYSFDFRRENQGKKNYFKSFIRKNC